MADSQIISAALEVEVTAEFFDPEASEETVRFCVEQDLREMYSDVEVKLLKKQKTGRWMIGPKLGEWICSSCGYAPTVFEGSRYCPDCGALMEVKQDAGP